MLAQFSQVIEPVRQEIVLSLKVLFVLVLTYIIAKLSDRIVDRRLGSVSRRMDVSKTSTVLLKRLINVAVWILGAAIAIYMVPGLRQISMALFASAGFIGIVVGFAAKEAFGNIIAGIFIAVFEPFRVGDKIETQQKYGTVEDITLRQTVIKTPSNERVIVPNNSILNDYIINYSIVDEKSRYSVDFSISYRDDIDQAKDIILTQADEHPLTEKGESSVIVKDLADSAVVLEMRIWAKDRADAWQAGQDIRETVKKHFDEEDITIPFPQRTISHLDEEGKSDDSGGTG